MAIRIDEYGHIIRDENDQNTLPHPSTVNDSSSGDRLYIAPNSTQVETPHLTQPQRKNSFLPILAVVGAIVFLALALKSCGSRERHAGYSNPPLQQNTQESSQNEVIYNSEGVQGSENEPAQEPPKELVTFSVAEISRDTLDVPGIFSGETITISEEPPVIFTGFSSNAEDKQVYSYTAPREGRYRFDLKEVSANASLRILVYNSSGERIMDAYNSSYITLNSGETYEIQVRNDRGESSYVLQIGVQKPTTDVSFATVIDDQVSFEDQRNVYTFTAPIDGRYRFDLTEVNANVGFRMMMWDHLDNNIMDSYSESEYITLNAGETYELQVRQDSGLGSYKMIIGFQKETQDITNYGAVNDSVQYEDQKNCYLFTAPIDGRYRFDLTEVNANVGFRMMMWDYLDNNVMDSYSESEYITLNAGETYELQIRQDSGLGSYKLVIGYQKEPIEITAFDVINDSVSFNNQKNVYYLTPTVTGTVRFVLENYNASCSLRLMAWDNYENNILDTYNDEGSISVEANKTYEIQVRQDSGLSSYSLYVERK